MESEKLNGSEIVLDEMVMEMAREYFSSMGKEEKKALLSEFLSSLSGEEKKEALEIALTEFAKDKELLERVREFAEAKK